MICNIEEVKVEYLKVPSGFKLYEFLMPLLNLGARTLVRVKVDVLACLFSSDFLIQILIICLIKQ